MPDRTVLRSSGLRYCCQRLLWLLVRNSVPVAAGTIKTALLREQRPMFAGTTSTGLWRFMAARCEAPKQLLGVVDLIVVVDRLVFLVGVEDYYRLTLIGPHEGDILVHPIGQVRIVQLKA